MSPQVRVCHKCKVRIMMFETYEGVKVRKKFDDDHTNHPKGNLELREASEYTNVNDKYTQKSESV